MPGLLDSALIPVVKTVVDLLGATVVFTVRTAGTFNAAQGAYVGETTADHSVVCTPPGDYRRYLPEGVGIERGDMQIGIPSERLAFEPVNGMKLVVAGKTWQITEVLPVYSGEQVALYLINVRGAK